jgi:hypothetical protein
VTCGQIAGDARLRGPATEFLLHRSALAYPHADPQQMVDEVFGRVAHGPAWAASVLLRMLQRAPDRLAPHLVPVVLAHLGDWSEDPDGARLAAALLKRIEFLPRRNADGSLTPRRAGVSDADIPLLNLLAATGPGWLTSDDGLYRRAAEVLMWAGRAWRGLDPAVQDLIAPRVCAAAFQVALAAEPAQAGTTLRSRITVVPIDPRWRAALPLGLERALPMIRQTLSLNSYRLGGELVCASTRAMVEPQVIDEPEGLPRLAQLPVGPVVRDLVADDPTGQVLAHFAGLVEQVLRDYDRRNLRDGVQPSLRPADRFEVLNFWRSALPNATVQDPAVIVEPEPEPEPMALWDAVAVAFGEGRLAVRAAVHTDLRHLLEGPRRPARVPTQPALPALSAGPRGPRRWWRRLRRPSA